MHHKVSIALADTASTIGEELADKEATHADVVAEQHSRAYQQSHERAFPETDGINTGRTTARFRATATSLTGTSTGSDTIYTDTFKNHQ